jgi:hypothetical protein
MVTLLLLVTLSLEAKLLLGEEEASAKLFPDDKVVDLVPETCATTGTTQAVTVTLTAETHAMSLLLFCSDFFLAHKPGEGKGKAKKSRPKKRVSFFYVCSATERRERSPGMGGEGEEEGERSEREDEQQQLGQRTGRGRRWEG